MQHNISLAFTDSTGFILQLSFSVEPPAEELKYGLIEININYFLFFLNKVWN